MHGPSRLHRQQLLYSAELLPRPVLEAALARQRLGRGAPSSVLFVATEADASLCLSDWKELLGAQCRLRGDPRLTFFCDSAVAAQRIVVRQPARPRDMAALRRLTEGALRLLEELLGGLGLPTVWKIRLKELSAL